MWVMLLPLFLSPALPRVSCGVIVWRDDPSTYTWRHHMHTQVLSSTFRSTRDGHVAKKIKMCMPMPAGMPKGVHTRAVGLIPVHFYNLGTRPERGT